MKIKPNFTIIAGVNGSGKTTFALDYYKNKKVSFINADLIATGLSPNNPDLSQFTAGRLMLLEIENCIKNRADFVVETTLASKNYLKVIQRLKKDGWQIDMVYLFLPSVDLSIKRVAERVESGGHNIRLSDIKRRYDRSLIHLSNTYFDVVNNLFCLDNEDKSTMIFKKTEGKLTIYNKEIYENILEYKNA